MLHAAPCTAERRLHLHRTATHSTIMHTSHAAIVRGENAEQGGWLISSSERAKYHARHVFTLNMKARLHKQTTSQYVLVLVLVL